MKRETRLNVMSILWAMTSLVGSTVLTISKEYIALSILAAVICSCTAHIVGALSSSSIENRNREE